MCVHRGEHACSEKHERASRFFLHFFQEKLRAPKAGCVAVGLRESCTTVTGKSGDAAVSVVGTYVFLTETEDFKAASSVFKAQSRERFCFAKLWECGAS